jgi:hypothetical protein
VRKSRLYFAQILQWAREHHKRTKRWPTIRSGAIPGTRGETWWNLDAAIRLGLRGLPSGSSLAQLLEEEYGIANPKNLPRLTIASVLAWADAYHRRHGKWPSRHSGVIEGVPDETWRGIDSALRLGNRGLPGSSSLAQLLARRRRAPNLKARPRLSRQQILIWADLHYRHTGAWPTRQSGAIAFAPGDSWATVDGALIVGVRGLPGGDSLGRLLARERGVRNRKSPPELTVEQVLRWAEAHRRRTGAWPTYRSGAIPEADDENWAKINWALAEGKRGLPRSTSLRNFLCRMRIAILPQAPSG